MLTCTCNVDPFTPRFYSKTLVNRGLHFSYIVALKYRLRVHIRTASVSQFLCLPQSRFKCQFFIRKLLLFTVLCSNKSKYMLEECYRNVETKLCPWSLERTSRIFLNNGFPRGIVQAVCVVKIKALISCAVTVQLIWAFDFAYICAFFLLMMRLIIIRSEP